MVASINALKKRNAVEALVLHFRRNEAVRAGQGGRRVRRPRAVGQ